MSLENKIVALAQAIGADVKLLTNKVGDLSSLPTVAKGNIVAAIDEMYSLIGSAGASIDDTAGAGQTAVAWSADKLVAAIAAAKSEVKSDILGGAGAALDTLKELADALGSDPNFASTIATQLGKRVRFDEAQTLTTPERAQACANIGVGDPEHDFVTDYNTAKA